jgi:hypothetical protein
MKFPCDISMYICIITNWFMWLSVYASGTNTGQRDQHSYYYASINYNLSLKWNTLSVHLEKMNTDDYYKPNNHHNCHHFIIIIMTKIS